MSAAAAAGSAALGVQQCSGHPAALPAGVWPGCLLAHGAWMLMPRLAVRGVGGTRLPGPGAVPALLGAALGCGRPAAPPGLARAALQVAAPARPRVHPHPEVPPRGAVRGQPVGAVDADGGARLGGGGRGGGGAHAAASPWLPPMLGAASAALGAALSDSSACPCSSRRQQAQGSAVHSFAPTLGLPAAMSPPAPPPHPACPAAAAPAWPRRSTT